MLDQIGKYRIASVLGQGAMGVAYRGVDPGLERAVAIKTIHAHLLGSADGDDLLARFKTEAMAAARCMHPNIVTVYDFGQHEGTPFIAMEFVSGRGLDDLMKEQKGLPLKRINAIILGICRGLNHAHQQSIVHRDIKPANILVSEGDTVKIADFGIALLPLSDAVQFGAGIGTPSYMSPEQREGRDVDQRADVFSLGVIIFELLSACVDFSEAQRTQPVKVIRALPPSKKLDAERLFPPGIAAFLDKCLAPEPEKRYSGCPQILEGYKAALQTLVARPAQGAAGARPTAGLTGVQPSITVGQPPARPVATDNDATQVSPGTAPDDSFYKQMSAESRAAQQGTVPVETATATKAGTTAGTATTAQPGVRTAVSFLDAMRTLKSIDPALNEDWHEKLVKVMGGLDQNGWERAYTKIVEPKGITYDPARKRFVFSGQTSVRDLGRQLTTPQLSALADKLATTLDSLASLPSILEIADALEGGLISIDRYDTAEKVTHQKEKLRLREAFLYEFAARIRRLNFTVHSNMRGLTLEEIREYIVEVFIKHQLMGYWFASLPLQDLARDPNPFIKGLVTQEAKTRSLTIVRTDRYYFLIGSVMRYEQNQYSIRRFLLEDQAMGGRLVYFNGLALDRRLLTQSAAQEKIRNDITRVITIQRQLSEQIIELVDSFGASQDKYLRPLLFKPIGADGTDLDVAIDMRLQEYEKNASRLVFGKMPRALTEMAKCQDDYEYLFIGLRGFLIEMLADVQDFSYQSSAQWTTKGKEMEYRIASYLRLLEKRKAALFVADGAGLTGSDPAQDADAPLLELMTIVDEFQPKLQDMEEALKEAIRQAAEKKTGMKKLLAGIGVGGPKADPEKIRRDMELARVNCFMAIVRVPKRHPKVSVYLEFEDLVPVDETVRHYAFPAGKLGIALLPVLLRLPENKDEFNIMTIRRAIAFDVFKSTQTWEWVSRPLEDQKRKMPS